MALFHLFCGRLLGDVCWAAAVTECGLPPEAEQQRCAGPLHAHPLMHVLTAPPDRTLLLLL